MSYLEDEVLNWINCEKRELKKTRLEVEEGIKKMEKHRRLNTILVCVYGAMIIYMFILEVAK